MFELRTWNETAKQSLPDSFARSKLNMQTKEKNKLSKTGACEPAGELPTVETGDSLDFKLLRLFSSLFCLLSGLSGKGMLHSVL